MSAKPNDDRRKNDAARKREQRAKEKDVIVPACIDREMRELLESDVYEWLAFFGAEEFTRQFTDLQRRMIAAILKAAKDGGDQAIAAPRGEGKTTVAEWVVIYAVLCGLVDFVVVFSATGSDAEDVLGSIKERFETNERLREYYPEICEPIHALENTPNRAHYQTVSGHRHDNGEAYTTHASKFSWCGREIVLPNVPGAPAAKAIIATRGLDAAVRGMKRGSRRPKLAVIDDPDTMETANSEEQADKLEKKIDRGIAGLSGQKKRLGRVMLTTLQNNRCVSAKFTDPEKKPSWHGLRFKFMEKPPDNLEKWEEFVALRQGDWLNGTTAAHDLYAANKESMDAGSVMSNPHRRGDSGELSALEFYYNEVARLGEDAVRSEYQNDPPEESGPVDSGITPWRVQRQISGYPRRVIPPGCTVITQGMDVRKVALHWVVRAWRPDGSGFTIDYGVHETFGTVYGSDDGVDVAIHRAILSRMESCKETEYMTTDGELKQVDLTLIDAGYRTDAVYSACQQVGLGVMPIMGFGHSSGTIQANFSEMQRRTRDKKPGDGWFLSRKGKLWLVCSDADRWKAWEHDRWMTSIGKPGVMTIFGESDGNKERLSADEKAHHAYARHITNETEVEEPYKGTIRRKWKPKSENTHWLDASAYSNVAASIKGIRILPSTKNATANIPNAPGGEPSRLDLRSISSPGSHPANEPPRMQTGQRMSLGQMAKRGRT
jgi:hypothetical protein